jgi:mono/diheme cytochrome c family protein
MPVAQFSPRRVFGALVLLLSITAEYFPQVTVADEPSTGHEIYVIQCARCHGGRGEGTEDFHPEPLLGDRSVAQLAALIAETMPQDTDEKCSPEDAAKVAAYIYGEFYSPEAQVRNKPARVELSRLTVRQYQNAVADLVGSFRRASQWGEERGLRAQYNPSRNFRRDSKRIERVDPEINFDWGVESPQPDKLDANEFSVRWQGTVLAPDTGEYEFVVHSEHATRLWVNDQDEPLIDAYVRATTDREFRASIHLLGGRAYPLKLEFSKAKQGVNDKDKKKDKPKPVKAYISLQWKRPHHTEEVVPARNLSVKRGPEVFVLQTAFPPDDRSVGYERGTSVSKAWDEATTEAAIETANYVASRLDDLADADPDNAEHEPRLREFCGKFVERALRRPLTDDGRKVYIDAQFAEAANLETAVKRVVLLALKSPRFLYRDLTDESDDSFATAARLSFGLWDTIPDEPLRRAAAENRLETRDQVVEQLQRMLSDMRSRAKLREFLLDWLKVSQTPELAKDHKAFPEFTAEVASDLRTSLELSVEELLDEEPADLRELLLTNSVYLNGRLARVYDVELPADAPFQKVTFRPDERSGIVSHPFLLANFAYTGTSSPIHRGVFISRAILGRVLRPPPESVAPLAPDLHPDLTTRERVSLQTEAQECQSCHGLINPLGFALEHLDAIGRFRQMERGRPVEATGGYLTRGGDMAKFDGVRELAAFLADSEETHEAFVRQLFHHTVKQPIYAYGKNRLPELKQAFVENDFDIRTLLMEILAGIALSPREG